MRGSLDSRSSDQSDLSRTALNANSTQPTPITPALGVFPASTPQLQLGHPSPQLNSYQALPSYEYGLTPPVQGWPHVAKTMADNPDLASFSRFRDLNVKSLLYYQAELTHLRRDLHYQEWVDNRNGDRDMQKFATRVDSLISSKHEPKHLQWDLIEQIRVTLKNYNEALLQYNQVSALPEPEVHNTKTLRKWLGSSKGDDFQCSGQGEEKTWGDPSDIEEDPSLARHFLNIVGSFFWSQPPSDHLDLVTARPAEKIDGFTRWVATRWIPFWANWCKQWRKNHPKDPEKHQNSTKDAGSQPEPTLATYSGRTMLRFTSSVSTIVACLLPTIAITVLTQVHGTRNLLLCLAGFAIIFAGGLIFLTSGTASRVEIFAATAAFSAVLVVFISNSTPIDALISNSTPVDVHVVGSG